LAPAAGEGVAVVAVGDTDRPVVGDADMPAVGVCPRAVAGQGMWQGSTARLQGFKPQQPESSLRSSDEARTRFLSRTRMMGWGLDLGAG
jgi:hypothetical protein